MSKAFQVTAAILCLLLLCACGRPAYTDPLPTSAPAEPDSSLVWPALEPAESLSMATFMGVNRAQVQGRHLYTLDYDEAAQPVLARYRLRDSRILEYAVLADNCVPQWLCELGGRLYYINAQSGGILESVRTDGSDRRYIRSGPCSWLSTRDGLLYYCREDGAFCSMVPGATVETVLVDGACFYPWLLDGDTLLYQSGDDGERLHLRSLRTGAERVLTDGPAYAPLVWDGRLWYTGSDGLRHLDADGGSTAYALPMTVAPVEYLPWSGALWVRGLSEDNGLRQWAAVPAGDFDTLRYSAEQGYRLCDFQDAVYRVDSLYQPDGRLYGFLLTDRAGNSLRYWKGEAVG